MYKMYFLDGGQDCFSKHSYLSLGSFHDPDFGITINSFIVSSVSIPILILISPLSLLFRHSRLFPTTE